MLLPSGRCYSHCRVVWVGRCYCQWQMEKLQGHFILILVLRCLTGTSSQTCGRWYLPTFLLRDGSLTLMYRASFIVLIWFKSSPPNNFEIIDGNTVTTDVTMVIYGREGFQVFLEPFSKSSRGLSNILLITVHPVTMIAVDDYTLFLQWL